MIGANLKEDPEELRQNVRFDLLHLENKKIALETIRKLKGSTVESPNIDMMAINHNTEPYAFDYALSPNPKSFKKRKEDDTINRIYLFKNESLLN